MLKSLFSAAVFILGAGVSFAGDPVVSNVRAQQRGGGSKLVDIYYDVADSDGDRQTVAVAITDGGTPIPATSLTGAVGANVTPGSGKQIVWDSGADWPGNLSENVRATVTADDGRTPPPPSDMVLIPGGTNAGTDPDDGTYSLTVDSFYMDRYEVTKALWDEVRTWATGNGYTDLPVGGGKAANHPVQTVSWFDCVKWLNARSKKDGRTPVYYTDAAFTQVDKTGEVWEPYVKSSADGYRLPTEVQWHYAARGGVVNRRFPWSDVDTIQHARANYCSTSPVAYDTSPTRGYHPTYATGGTPYTSPVGSFAANGYGVYDMAGNVFEWCYDWSPGYEGSGRVIRGGDWGDGANYCRVAFRGPLNPGFREYSLGFRAVLPPGQQ